MPPVIDMHIHIASRQRSDCKVSDEMLLSPSFAYMLVANHINPLRLKHAFDGTIREHVLGPIGEATLVEGAVVLALDAIYTSDGQRREVDSGMIVSNEYVRELAAANPKVLVGASVNPYRGETDGMRELERCLTGPHPAALIKWLPNSQVIDPSEARHDWFYRALVQAKVPLLCHTGSEYAVPVPSPVAHHQKLGDPRLLTRALESGVTVIIAHAATRFFPTEREDYLEDVAALLARFPNAYADLSAMCVLCRIGTVDRVLDTLPPERLLLGSDFPIPVSDMPPLLVKHLTPAEHLEIVGMSNPLDKNYRQLLAIGFPPSIGTKAAELLNPAAVGAGRP
jgi:uncharacterized protein